MSNKQNEVDAGVVAAWEQEIADRLEEVKSGRVTPIPLAEALRRIKSEDL